MKKSAYSPLLLLIVGLFFSACSSQNDVLTEENPQEESLEKETTEYHELLPQETRNYMVDPSATDETVALFYNLKTISASQFLVGQQDAFSSFYDNSSNEADIKKTTGSNPALLGSDFMFITDDENNGQTNNWFYQQELQITTDAIGAYNSGMVNIFSWHFREPYEGEAFYTSEMTEFQKNNAFVSILPGGANHEYYKEKLQKIAEVAQNLMGADGNISPIIFRPFHEFDGDFFWWGAPYASPEQFKQVWRFTVEYLRDELNVHNILYAYAPDNSYSNSVSYLQRYPGDDYVDILAMDNYGDLGDNPNVGLANAKLKVVSDLALEKVKIAALSETGFFKTPANTFPPNYFSEVIYNTLTNDDVQVSFMMFWSNTEDSYTVPVPGSAGEEDFLDFIEKEEIILLDEIPSIYTLSE